MDGLTRSLALLRERVAGVAEALGTFESTWDPTVAKTHEGHQRWLVTGTGASEGPARWFVEALATTGRSARYMPLSCFAVGDPLATSDALAVFSQGLCPNARLALRAHSKPTVLFTSTPPEREQPLGASPITRVVLPPKSENDLLLRVAGPAVATAASDWFARALDGEPPGMDAASWCQARSAAVKRVAEAIAGVAARYSGERIAFVTVGASHELYHGFRWKFLEGLGVPDPHMWDVLQVVHGPFQQFVGEPLLICALHRAGEPNSVGLLDRLDAILTKDRHQLLRLPTRQGGLAGWLELDAMINALLCALLTRRPRDLINWPGKGADRPLYTISEPLV